MYIFLLCTILYVYAYFVLFAFSGFSFVCYFPLVLWYCWMGLFTCKNRLPYNIYNLYCVGRDVKPFSIKTIQSWTGMSWWGNKMWSMILLISRLPGGHSLSVGRWPEKLGCQQNCRLCRSATCVKGLRYPCSS